MLYKNVLYWFVLNILMVASLMLSLYLQLTPNFKNISFIEKIGWSELFALIELAFIIPLLRIGHTFLSPSQLTLFSFGFMFIGQILSDSYLLNITTSLDDYVAMIIVMLGLFVSLYKVFG